ncbi:MAG: hypothetical protein ACODAQ_03635 [Phycisphaeraceae bacterium]
MNTHRSPGFFRPSLLGLCLLLALGAQSAAERENDRAPLTPQRLLEAAQLGGEYAMNATMAQGRFVYLYDPQRDAVEPGYNMLRHAGTVYSMFQLYEASPNERLRRDALRALDYMHRRIVVDERNDETVAYLLDDDDAKLGGNGLALLATTEYMRVTGEPRRLWEAQRMAAWIAQLQQPSGEFRPHIIEMPEGEAREFTSLYYPGEAMLGLVRLHAIDGDERWLDVAARAADWLIASRRDVPDDELPHDCWFLLALDELHRLRPKAHYVAHARRLARVLVDAQVRAETAPVPEWIGGFNRPPRPSPTSTRTEALCAAYRLLRDHGEADEPLDEIRATIERGVRFQLRMQYTREQARGARRPRLVAGGFPASFEESMIRIDYVQHNISSFLALRALMQEGRGETR